MKNLRLLSLLFLVSAFALTSCSKSTGPAGPVGPAGPDSVSYSAWTQLNMTSTVGTNNNTFFVQNISAPSITQSVLDKSVILSYLSFKDQAGGTNVFNASEITNMEITFAVGTIQLLSDSNYSFANTGWSYRYVTVRGTISVNGVVSWQGEAYTKGQLRSMSYQEIVKLLSIKEEAGVKVISGTKAAFTKLLIK
jgi:hypothetical protein